MKRKRFSAVLGCILALTMLAGITVPLASATATEIEFLNPKGKLDPIDNQALADRQPLADKLANGEEVNILLLFYEKASNSELLIALGQLLQERYPNIKLTRITNNHATWSQGTGPAPFGTPWGAKTGAGFTDGHPYNEEYFARYENWATYDAVMLGIADCNVCTWWSSYHAKVIESLGTPCVVVTNETYENTQWYGAQDNGFTRCRRAVIDGSYYARSYMYSPSGSYYLTDAQINTSNCIAFLKTVVDRPPVSTDLLNRTADDDNYMGMYSDLYMMAKESTLDQVEWAITAPLTEEDMNPRPVTPEEMGDLNINTLKVTGVDNDDAIQNFNKLAMDLKFGDGLPLVIPTRDLVDEMLAATTRLPDEMLGKIKMRGGIATVEKVAINAVMAGARPEYFPVILAAAEALSTGWEEDKCYWHPMTTGSTGQSIMILVSGPIADEIGMESGLGLNGAGNEVNNTIGRAVRLLFRNIGHNLTPDIDTSWRMGRPNDHTLNVCAENIDALPEGWKTHSEIMGFPEGSSTVTVLSFASSINLSPNYGDRSTYTVANLTSLGSSGSNTTVVMYSPAMAQRLWEDTTAGGGGYKTKEALVTTWNGAVQNTTLPQGAGTVSTTARLSWPVVVGDDPGGAYQLSGSYYQATNYQTQLISGATLTEAGKGATPPSTPQNFNVKINVEDRTATLTWDPPMSDGGSDILRYQVYNLDGGQQTAFEWIDVPEGAEANSYTFTNLQPGVQYFFRVRAVNGVDNARYYLNSGVDTHVILFGSNIRYYVASLDRSAGHGGWACFPSVTPIPGRIRAPGKEVFETAPEISTAQDVAIEFETQSDNWG